MNKKQIKSDEYFMTKALIEAKISLKEGDWPIGCVIVLNNRVISHAHNQVYSTNNKLAHAEKIAIEKAQKKLLKYKNQAVLYTTCEPCMMCLGAAILSKVTKIVFGIKENCGAIHLQPYLPITFQHFQYKFESKGGILADECWELFIKGEPTKKLLRIN